MAENKSQAQHLTSLDFDISGLIESLRQADEQTQKYALEIGKNFYNNFQKGASEGQSTRNITTPKFVDEDSIESATQQVAKLETEYGKLAKTVENYNSSGKLIGGKNTFIDSSGIETVVKYNEKLEEVGQTMTANYAKAEKVAEAQLKKEQALRDNFYKKNMTQIDAEIAERERQAKVFSSQIQEQMTLRVKEEAEAQKVVSQIERMVEKQKQFNNLVSQQKTSSKNKEIISQSNQYISDLEKLKEEISSTGKVTQEQKNQIASYGDSIKQLSGDYQEAGTKGESFLQKISDKAKWLGAFYVVNELKNGLLQIVDVIKTTEDAVIDLQRVLNDDSISQSRITDELYDIAYEYGRTFEEAAEVAQQFVQAGYNWTDAVETTRGTMLALNTAELDVTQSTEGLIAVMAQWNLDAEDYADVIDKINITADNFAVTSEKIVTALQRSSSSAKNANISLEETIGIITALAEATGRSGENIGTALNSLIIYTSKSSALETFAENGSEAMKKVVDDYNKGAASIYDVWVQLSDELSNLSAAQQAALFNSEEYAAFADELESQAEEFTSQVKEIYGAAGTYRQNYFIALLNDMAKAYEAIKGMADAEGYSLTENEKYMQGLTANWNQLKATLAELAVQLGEAGLLDTLKVLTEIGVGITKLTKSLGGIITPLSAIAGIIITIKAQKMASAITEFGTSIKNTIASAKNFVTTLTSIATAENKVAAANQLLQSSFGWIGIALTAFSALYAAISGVNNAIEAQKQAARESAATNLENAKSLEELKTRYVEIVNYTGDAAEKTQQLADFKKELITQYGLEREAVEKLNGARADEIDFLNQEIKASIDNAWIKIQNQYKKAVDAIESASTKLDLSYLFSIDENSLSLLSEYFDIVKTSEGKILSVDFRTEDLYEQRDLLASILANNELNERVATALRNEYSRITSEIEKWDDVYQQGVDIATSLFFSQEKTLDLIEKINEAETESEQKEFYDQLIASVEDTNFGLQAQESIIETINAMFPQYQENAEEALETTADTASISQEEIDALKESYEELSDVVSSFQSAYDAVNSALEEYNENGYLSVDTISQLLGLGSEYLSMLNFTADGISLNEGATRNLLSAQADNINAMIQQAATAELLQIAQKYLSGAADDTASSASNATSAAQGYTSQLSSLAEQAIGTTMSINAMNQEIANIFGGTVTGANLRNMQQEMRNVLNTYSNFANSIGNLSANTQAWSNNAANSVSGAASKATNAVKEQLEAQKEAVKDRYDAEIQALKDVEEENDRIRKEEEYYRNRQEALADIEKAATRSGVEYREQEDEARQKLEELDREWQQTVEDWSIEDKIEELEALRDAEIAALDAQIDALEKSSSAVGSGMVNSASKASDSMLQIYQNDFLDKAEEETEKTSNDIGLIFSESFSRYDDDIINHSKNLAGNIRRIYENEFFLRIRQSYLQMFSELSQIQIISPKYPNLGKGEVAFRSPFISNSYTRNTNNNTNVFANVNNASSADSLINRIFKMP